MFERTSALRRRLVVLFSLTASALPLGAGTCVALARLTLPQTSITTAVSVPAGDFAPVSGRLFHGLPPFCRVVGTIRPSADSDIQFEVWMPLSGWNGKLHGAGNGGFAGDINYAEMAVVLGHGYAAVSTDTGHKAAFIDASWAVGHPEKVIDFGYRAIHETAQKAKAILGEFYGVGPKRSYFMSCSNGGRQALMEAQRFPDDYDGIIAGAPANFWTHLLVTAVADSQALLLEPGGYIPPDKLPAIQSAALKACDHLDGVRDGVIENPPSCRWDPGALLCKGVESDGCLTAPQVTALQEIYGGPRTSKGKQVFPGYSPGGEGEPGGWAVWITGAAPQRSLMFQFGTEYFKGMVFADPAWDFRAFQLDRDLPASDQKMSPVLNSVDPDLRRFQARGGKLIVYHGWSDAAIPAQNAVDYYQSVLSKVGAATSGRFIRLFMVPGMQHCGGGSGPDAFGQFGGGSGDPRSDMAAALERWVEQGIAPEEIVAAKLKNPTDPVSRAIRTRPLCAYPLIARWKGTGSTDEAANFNCTKP